MKLLQPILLALLLSSTATAQSLHDAESQHVAFSATPAFDCRAGTLIDFGFVTGNVTGATMSAPGRYPGQHCTIVLVKDASVTAYTFAFTGTNVRSVNVVMGVGVSSLGILNFFWDRHLPTPAWVQVSAAVNVP